MLWMSYFYNNLDNIKTAFVFSIFFYFHIHERFLVNNSSELHFDKIINLELVPNQTTDCLLHCKPLMLRIDTGNELPIEEVSNRLNISGLKLYSHNFILPIFVFHDSDKNDSSFAVHKADNGFS